MSLAQTLGLSDQPTASNVLRAGIAGVLRRMLDLTSPQVLHSGEIAGCRFVYSKGALTLTSDGEWAGKPDLFAKIVSRAARDVQQWRMLVYNPTTGAVALWDPAYDDVTARDLASLADDLQSRADARKAELGKPGATVLDDPEWMHLDRQADESTIDLRRRRRALALAAIGEAFLAAETRKAPTEGEEI